MRLTVQWQDRSREPHAGQFYMLRAWAADATPILSRPISVDDFDNQTGALTFLYQVKGEGTHKLAALKKDDTLTVTGPCGNGFDTAALAGQYKRIAVGGGGIPVVRKDGKLCGTPAVIDKDFGSELLAELLDADVLVILTAVEQVAINFNKPDQKGLDDLTPAQAKVYMDENQFAKGSMLPKVQAAVKFAESKAGRTALITLLEKAKDGIEGKTGTRVHR